MDSFVSCLYFEFYALNEWQPVEGSAERGSRHSTIGKVDESSSRIHDGQKGG